jgi:hypothetical protein
MLNRNIVFITLVKGADAMRFAGREVYGGFVIIRTKD